MQRPPLLALSEARLGYPGRVVLHVRALEIRMGEDWFVLGPNGAGKTTLLRTILGLLPPLQGEIKRATELTPTRIGFVPQQEEGVPFLPTTLREFVRLGLAGVRLPAAERAVRLARALDRVDLLALAHASFSTLSGGQRQRALLARALIREPHLLILDEPTNGLDPAAEESLLGVLQDLRPHLSTIVVTHDVALAARHATHVAFVAHAELRAGRKESMLTDAELKRVFGLNPLLASPLAEAAHVE